MAALLPLSWEVGVKSKEFAVCMLLPYFSTRHDVALNVASVASANTAVSAAVFVSGIPCCFTFRRKM
jgi:hypothetical protein